jgi:hypothetical protein
MAIVPAAPLLVPGVSARLPDGLEPVRAATEAALEGLPEAETAVLLAAGEPAGEYAEAEASLAGFGRPDIAVGLKTAEDRRGHRGPLPPGLAVLALLVGHEPVTPTALDAGATAGVLSEHAGALARDPRRIVVLAAGDLSAGLDERSPRFRVEGAQAWDHALVTAVRQGDTGVLAALGPAGARRVAALGWAPIVVAQAACGGPLRVLHYSAPRGVGYLVARR